MTPLRSALVARLCADTPALRMAVMRRIEMPVSRTRAHAADGASGTVANAKAGAPLRLRSKQTRAAIEDGSAFISFHPAGATRIMRLSELTHL